MVYPRDNAYPDDRFEIRSTLDFNENLDTARNLRGVLGRNNVGHVVRVREDSVDVRVDNDDGNSRFLRYCRVEETPYPLTLGDQVHLVRTSAGVAVVRGIPESRSGVLRNTSFLAYILTEPQNNFVLVSPAQSPRTTIECAIPQTIDIDLVHEGLIVAVHSDTGLPTSAEPRSWQPVYWLSHIFYPAFDYRGNPGSSPYVGLSLDDNITVPRIRVTYPDAPGSTGLTPAFSPNIKYYQIPSPVNLDVLIQVDVPVEQGYTVTVFDVRHDEYLERRANRTFFYQGGTLFDSDESPTTFIVTVAIPRDAVYTLYTIEYRQGA